MKINDYFKHNAARVDAWLERLLPAATEIPATIHEAMRYSIFVGGKRLRPLLAIATGECFAAPETELLPVACALEMIHTYSLIHDDLPAMDNDTLRRGRPTNHVIYGEAIAILAGDALLTHAFCVLSNYETEQPARQLAVLREVANAAGTRNALIGGQVLDLQFEGQAVTAAQLEQIHRAKTGALIRCSARVGAILGGASEVELAAVTEYSEKIGLAFQIADDVLDATATTATLGKTAGKDAAVEKATYTALYGVAGAMARARQLHEEALAALGRLPQRERTLIEPLAELAHFIIERKS